MYGKIYIWYGIIEIFLYLFIKIRYNLFNSLNENFYYDICYIFIDYYVFMNFIFVIKLLFI